MPVKKCSNGKWRIGSGKCMYDTKEDAEKAMQGWKASESMAEAKSRLTEKKSTVKVTRGMANHVGRVKYTCPECGLKVAKYKGRYPHRCFTGDTKVSLLDGREVSLRDLSDEVKSGKSVWVYSCRPDGEVTVGKVTACEKTQENASLVKVTFDNGETVRCTPDHLFMLRDGSYKEVQSLESQESLMPLYKKTGKSVNHKVVSVEFLNETEDVYDLTVDDYHNFALTAGVFVHNCPNCQAELPRKKKQESSLREKVEGLIQEISAGKSSSDKAAVSLLSPASKKAGYMNAIMRKVNASEMIDYYVGYSEDESSALRPTWIKLMFSRHTPKEAVGELARDLDKVAAKISLDKGGDQEKPLWVITLSQPRISDEPMMQGDVGVGVDMAGQV